MADQHLSFSIGSTFSGEGFQAAQNTVTELHKSTVVAVGAVNQLGSAMGGMDSCAAKASRAVTTLLNALMSANPVTVAITLAVGALTAALSSLKEAQAAAKAAADDFIKTQSAVNERINAGLVERAVANMKDLSREFETVTKQASDLAAAVYSLDRERSKGGIIALQAEKVSAVMNEVTEEARRLVAAEYDLKIATEKAAAARYSAELDLSKAHQDVLDQEHRVANLSSQRAEVLDTLATLEKSVATAKENNLTSYQSGEAKLASLREKLAEIDDSIASAKARTQVLLINEQTATEKLNNAVAAAEIEVVAATGRIDDLKRNAEAAAAAEGDLADKSSELAATRDAEAERLKAEAEAKKEYADVQASVNEAAKELEAAERDLAAALAKYAANYAENEMTGNIFAQSRRRSSMSVPVRVEGRIKADVVAKDVESAIKGGLIGSVRDMDNFSRQRSREVDQLERDKLKQLEVETQKYQRLQEQSRKTWSKADVDFVRKFEMIRAAAESQKREIEEARDRVKAAEQREKENNTNLKSIVKKMNSLGLK